MEKPNKLKFRQFIAFYIATFIGLLVYASIVKSFDGYALITLPAINALVWVIGFNKAKGR